MPQPKDTQSIQQRTCLKNQDASYTIDATQLTKTLLSTCGVSTDHSRCLLTEKTPVTKAFLCMYSVYTEHMLYIHTEKPLLTLYRPFLPYKEYT